MFLLVVVVCLSFRDVASKKKKPNTGLNQGELVGKKPKSSPNKESSQTAKRKRPALTEECKKCRGELFKQKCKRGDKGNLKEECKEMRKKCKEVCFGKILKTPSKQTCMRLCIRKARKSCGKDASKKDCRKLVRKACAKQCRSGLMTNTQTK